MHVSSGVVTVTFRSKQIFDPRFKRTTEHIHTTKKDTQILESHNADKGSKTQTQIVRGINDRAARAASVTPHNPGTPSPGISDTAASRQHASLLSSPCLPLHLILLFLSPLLHKCVMRQHSSTKAQAFAITVHTQPPPQQLTTRTTYKLSWSPRTSRGSFCSHAALFHWTCCGGLP